MTLEIGLVLLIALLSVLLFVTERVRMDAVAILVLAALAVAGLADSGTALSGFSNPATVTVAAMFVLAAGLQNSGALARVGNWLERARSPTQFLLMLFAVLLVIAPFVSNTAIVAVFMPIVIGATARVGMPASRALIPLSFVSQMAGVTTLIGTSTNLIVDGMARELGHPGFSMFEFAPLGLICMAAGCTYLLLFGRALLPDTRATGIEEHYDIGQYLTELRVTPDSALVGSTIGGSALTQIHDIAVIKLIRDEQIIWAPGCDTHPLQAGDVLLVRGSLSELEEAVRKQGLVVNSQGQLDANSQEGSNGQQVFTEVMVAPRSYTIGSTLEHLDRRWDHDAVVLGIQRRGQAIRTQMRKVRFQVGDILLMFLPRADMDSLRRDRGLIVLSERVAHQTGGWRARFALITMALVVLVAALGLAPIAITSVVGAVAVTMAGCLNADEVYESIDWRIIVLMGGLLPLGAVMSSTGAAAFLVDHTIGLVRGFGPHVVLAVMYLMTLLLAEMMSSSAAAVLLTPVGLFTADILGVDATPFLIAVTFSASTSFLTPVGYQTNTMVYTAGNYRFTDFIRIGLPLNLIFWILGVLFIPVFWPF